MGLKRTAFVFAIMVLSLGFQKPCYAQKPAAGEAVRKEKDLVGAKAAFMKGQKLYKAEEYALALPFFEKAYELSQGKSTTILALAQCERMNKMYAKAIKRFKEYLATNPAEKHIKRVHETLKILQTLHEQKQKEEAKKQAEAKAQKEARQKETERLAKELAAKLIAPAPQVIEPVSESNILASPWLWLGVGLVSAGAVGGLLLTNTEDLYSGNTDVLIELK